ncbi:uncharacterized protein LOC120273836 [Dioscorea cayenensis subsp. rotundata]|uniref:Uncharacterized protein LOC120273836 n=1 Tax=Dioscorea cayennensis subsp. rotundata TaxID=55577 RepID=A0AB40CCM2_DIOCR|nr:uncharacterized protein LOC120273836 [Dioscorea cayenensis subsp. rotundata]
MGKRPPPAKSLGNYARLASERVTAARLSKPRSRSLDSAREPAPSRSDGRGTAMEGQERLPLSMVVAECVKRWFQDTLKEARNGDAAMQVLVGQMYQSGYGVPRNEQKAKTWMTKASKYRSSVWRVSHKRPGYNASDSDSVEETDDPKP